VELNAAREAASIGFMSSRASSVLLIVILWAALYLPFLGSLELRGEEGKRVMPAVQMFERGNYLVPYLGARPYLNKPPLINWLVAASFRTFGIRDEWSARLPSAISVLLVALALVTVGKINLGSAGSTIAAAFWLTLLEVIDKGRAIETDAINASLFALALIFWLTFWQRNRSPWITFTVPWIFLGLGFLAKGPGLLLFFYFILIAVAWRTRRLRELFHPAHFVGVVIMLTVVAVWAIPFFFAIRSQSLGQVWLHELSAILFGEKGRSENWALNFPRAIAFFLPWVLLLPFVRFNKIDNVIERETARGLAWGALIPFVVVLLLPGTVPRYVLPLAAPLCWVIGVTLASDAFEWRRFRIQLSPLILKWAIAIAITAEVIVVPARAAILSKKHQVLKPTAARVNAAMPANAPLYAIDQTYQPFLFYVHAPVLYLLTLEELPSNARFFLIQSRDLDKMKMNGRWDALQPRLLARTDLFRSNDTMLFSVTENQPNQ
jgi:4-amino-4-deoxy-L-arabinose transferase-like glycosyltransferase